MGGASQSQNSTATYTLGVVIGEGVWRGSLAKWKDFLGSTIARRS
jgi:hypothetical protein